MISKDQLNITNIYRILICMRPVIVQVYIGIRITQNVFVKFWMFYFYCCLWVHSDRRLFCMCEDFPPKKNDRLFSIWKRRNGYSPLVRAPLLLYDVIILYIQDLENYIYIYIQNLVYISNVDTPHVLKHVEIKYARR